MQNTRTFARLSRYVRDEHIKVNIVYNMVILLDESVENGFIFIANIQNHLISRSHFGDEHMNTKCYAIRWQIKMLAIFCCDN